jgi:hypothetical protein
MSIDFRLCTATVCVCTTAAVAVKINWIGSKIIFFNAKKIPALSVRSTFPSLSQFRWQSSQSFTAFHFLKFIKEI